MTPPKRNGSDNSGGRKHISGDAEDSFGGHSRTLGQPSSLTPDGSGTHCRERHAATLTTDAMTDDVRKHAVFGGVVLVTGGLLVIVALGWIANLVFYVFTGHFPPDL